MPYSKIDELPDAVKKKYSPKQQRAFMGAFNSTMEGCDGKDCEGKAMAAGHSAAQNAAKKQVMDDDSIGYGDVRLSQMEANYNPVGMAGGKACANCRWFDGYNGCHVVRGIVQPTGYSDLYMPILAEADMPEIEVNIELETIEEEETPMMKAAGKVKRLLGLDRQDGFETPSGFKLLNEDTFIAWYTNPYQDRDREWFAEKALENDVSYMWQSGDLPTLRFWHIKGADFGDVKAVTKAGRFVVGIGKIRPDTASKALAQYAVDHGYKLSHGFYYDPAKKIDNVYHEFHTFEISVLDAKSASNPHTFFAVEKGAKMFEIPDAAKQALEDALKNTGTSLENILKEGVDATKAADAATQANFKAATENEAYKALETRVAGIEAGIKQLTDLLTAQKADMPKKDDKPADDEEQKPAEKSTPRAIQQPALTDEMKQALISEMETNQTRALAEKKFQDLNVSEQLLAKMGMGKIIGLDGGQ